MLFTYCEKMFESQPSPRAALKKILKTHLWMKLIIALALGVATGFALLHFQHLFPDRLIVSLADWIALPGSLYLTLIQMVIVPLILSSLILALADITQLAHAKNITVSAFIFIVVSTIGGALIGIIVTSLFQPGVAIHEAARPLGELAVHREGVLSLTPHSLLKLIPSNPLATLVNGDLLDVLMISLIFGLVISKMDKKKSAILLEFMEGTQALCMLLITWTIQLAPYAVFGLMVRAVVNSGASVLMGMLGYLSCTFFGYVLIALAWLAWLTFIGVNPWSFLKNCKEPLLLAFSLSSSAATMPTTLETAKHNLKIPAEIADFLIPMGTALNMAGSALWQSSATFFLAQAFGSTIDLPTIITIIILTIGASIGTPGVPGAGVGVLNVTLRSVGVPATGIPLILGVDRLVDMGCTVVNVMGDLVMCQTTMWAIQRKDKAKMKEKEGLLVKRPKLLEQEP